MNTRRILMAVLAMILPLVVRGEEYTVEIDGICYNLTYIEGKFQEAIVIKKTSGNYSGAISIPNSVTYQGDNYIVTTLGQKAFYGCSGLTSVTIPNSVTTFGQQVFYNCSGLTSVTIPNSVTTLGQQVFSNCSSLTSVTIPNSVTTIGLLAFSGCSGLTSLTIPNSVTTIGKQAFSGCSGLTSLTIPNSVTTIGEYAFQGCSGLTSVTIPNSVTTIGVQAFSGCSGLMSVDFLCSPKSVGSDVFSYCKNIKEVTFDCVSVVSLFGNASSVTKITMTEKVTTIGQKAFYNCSALTSLTIPNSVTTIRNSAFWGCSGLTSLTIPNSVTTLGDYAFYGCSGLTSLTIPNSVTTIGEYAFRGCSGLTSVTIPNSVTTIHIYAFGGCSGLTSVTIPNSVTTIEKRAFLDCSKLATVQLGKSIKSIQKEAFCNCKNLTDVTCLAKSVPSTASDVFNGSYIEYATLHVYESSIDAYKAASPWNSFKSIVVADIPMYTLTYMVDGAIYKTAKYEQGDKITPEAEPSRDGYTFSGWSEIPETMPASDVTVTGTFTVDNTQYTLTYMVDGEVYKSYQLKAGSTIIPESEPTKEGYTFSGWSEIPEEMPAHNVTITGTFTRISLGKCASPSIELKGGRIVFGCETDGVEYNYDIKSNVSLNGKGNDILVNPSITVSVYASKDSYDDSDVTTKDILLSSSGMNLDANGDGVINAADVVTIVNAIMTE